MNSLREEKELLIPKLFTVLKGKNTFSYFGVTIWNSIPNDIKN